MGWIWDKKFVCTLWLAVHCIPYEISRRARIFLRIRIRQQGAQNIRQISNLLKTFEVQTLLNSNSNFITFPALTDL